MGSDLTGRDQTSIAADSFVGRDQASIAVDSFVGRDQTSIAAQYDLVIGDKNYSSWSLRPWLLMKVLGIPFREVHIRLRQPDSRAQIAQHSPSAKVPVIKSGGLVIWDSLAIAEFIADEHTGYRVWPEDKAARAVARAVSAEMHSGFYSLRNEMPMDFVNIPGFPNVSDGAKDDIARVVAIWMDVRRRFGGGGAFLFGQFSAADAMFAPVVSRFVTYTPDLAAFGDDGTAVTYRDMMMALPEMLEWGQGAREELAARG